MKLRKYFAADMRQAINLARQEQGPDVVILSNRKVLGGVELIAAEDYDESLFRQSQNENAGNNNLVNEYIDDRPTAIETKPVKKTTNHFWSQEASMQQMQKEINSMRSLLEQQLSSLAWGDTARKHPLWVRLVKRFESLGIEASIARRLVEKVPEKYTFDKAWRMALALLSYQIPLVRGNYLAPGRALAFIGASGAGKTTTIAKLAAKYVLMNGPADIILATVDSYRVGGREQLRSYARILGIPMRTLNNDDDIRELFQQYYRRKLILIDTAGLPIKNNKAIEQINILQRYKKQIDFSLVLPANSEAASLQRTTQFYKACQPGSCILTKLDETELFGQALSIAINNKLKIAYTCSGQNVPNDIKLASCSDLISKTVAISKDSQLSNQKMYRQQFSNKKQNRAVLS